MTMSVVSGQPPQNNGKNWKEKKNTQIPAIKQENTSNELFLALIITSITT